MDSPAGDYIGAGQNHYYTAADGTFSASKNFDNGVSVSFNGSGHNWNLDFVAAGDAPLAPGTYSGAARYPFQSSNQPGLSVSGDGRGCNELSGSFTINEIVYGADTTVVRFDASFSQSCEESMPPLTGRVLFNSTSAMPPRNRIISELTAYATAGQAFSYQIKTSRTNTTFSADGLPAGLAINTAAGLISGTPTQAGSYQVSLSASGSDGTATATLNLTVDPPGRSTGAYSALDLRSDPGDYIGQGKTIFLRSADGRSPPGRSTLAMWRFRSPTNLAPKTGACISALPPALTSPSVFIQMPHAFPPARSPVSMSRGTEAAATPSPAASK